MMILWMTLVLVPYDSIDSIAALRMARRWVRSSLPPSMKISGKGCSTPFIERLLQKNAENIKSGAGQYFTPRPLIKAMVEVVRPQPDQSICDPACGTGGFLLAANDFISSRYTLDKDQKKFLRFSALKGWEIVDAAARLCVMNLYLHGIRSIPKFLQIIHHGLWHWICESEQNAQHCASRIV
jgi:hypothetical protein